MTRSERKVEMMPVDSLSRLLDVMARLRDPDCGCPWDLKQTFETIAPYAIEEAYEVADAIRSGNRAALKDELGDLLLQVVFQAQMAKEEGSFTFNDIVAHLTEKMIRRHPHIFAEEQASDADAVLEIWQKVKDSEKDKQPADSLLDGVGRGMPALLRAFKLQKRAAAAGFEWKNSSDIFDKLDEEVAELREAMAATPKDPAAIEDELGDVLFVMVNIARKLEKDSETALARACDKFERRFRAMEQILRERYPEQAFESLTLEQRTEGWVAVKAMEKARTPSI